MPDETNEQSRVDAPVRYLPTDNSVDEPEEGIGLCLSGGGYRSMLFHLGSLWRLNQLGYLPKLERISSVSGGSITAGALALNWSHLNFDDAGVARNFNSVLVDPVRKIAGKTIDAFSIFTGAMLPGSIADKVVYEYKRHLFGEATLQDIPDSPRFIINATNVQSGALWRFSKPYMGDFRVGLIKDPDISLAVAVAASSAFPPVLSPLELDLDGLEYSTAGIDLSREPFTTRVILTDGGVYDNLALETVWKRYKTVLVSDGGGKMEPEAEPKRDWARHSRRVLDLIDNQVRSLRKRQIIDSLKQNRRKGTYWGIRTNIKDYQLDSAIDFPFDTSLQIANEPTRLKRLEPSRQEALINWGYAVCDAAMRKHVLEAPKPDRLPYSES